MRFVGSVPLWLLILLVPCPAQRQVDASHIHTAPGTITRSLEARLLDEIVNVKDYGAVGDGRHDDTGAIQAACAAAKSSGKRRIYFPATNAVYLISRTLHMDGCRMTGDYTVLNYSAGSGSRIAFHSTAAPTTMIEMDGSENGQLLQNAIDGLYIDCNGQASTGVLLTAVNGHFSDTTIHGCTGDGLIVDGAQNSVFDNMEVSGSAVNMRVVNGTSSCRFSRIEHAGAKVAHLRMGLDPALPGYGRREVLSVPFNGANLFGPSNIYSDGGSYQYALDIDHSTTNVWFNNVITPSSPQLVALIRMGTNGYGNRFNDNMMTMGQTDVPVFLNAMPSTYVRGGSMQMAAKCQHHPITLTGGSMFFSAVQYNDACLLDVANTTSFSTARILQWDDGTRGGPANVTPGAPKGTVGSTYFDSQSHQLRIWDVDHYVDANGNMPSQCQERRGHGSPNGVVAGNVCDKYVNLDGPSHGAVLEYTKEYGAAGSTTGWVGQAHGAFSEAVLPADVVLTPMLTPIPGLSLTLETKGVYEISLFVDVACAAATHCLFQSAASPSSAMHLETPNGLLRTTLSQQFRYTNDSQAPDVIAISAQAISKAASQSTAIHGSTHLTARLLYAF